MPKLYFETISEITCKYAKNPSPALNGAADWWKNMPKNFDKKYSPHIPDNLLHKDLSTIRNCPGVNDAVNFGYMMYFPTDIFIDSSKEDITWFVPNVDVSLIEETGLGYATFNPQIMTKDFDMGQEFHPISLKLNPLWGIKTDPGYSVWFTSPINRPDLPFKIVDAVVDTDKFPSRFPVSFYVKNNFVGTIKGGTPFLQIIPFKRENFDSEIIDLDKKDVLEKNIASQSTFTNPYKKFFWTRKIFK